MTTTLKVLEGARKTLDSYESWIQGTLVTDSRGNRDLSVHSAEAACFCVRGALMRSAGGDLKALEDAEERVLEAVVAYYGLYPFAGVPDWNDDDRTEYDDVVNVLEMAIGYEKKAQARE